MYLNTRKIKALANKLIKEHNLTIPIDLFYLAERLKIEIVETKKLKTDGFTLPIHNEEYNDIALVIIKKDISNTRKRFTIAHEIYHALEHRNLVSPYAVNNDFIEQEANIFAAELLMPANEVKRAIFEDKIFYLDDLAYLFYVSKQAMQIRLKRLGFSFIL